MAGTLDALLAIMQGENIVLGCSETREAVAQMCVALRKSSRFPCPISYTKIKILLGID
jgi:hypothetical protein